MVQIILEMSLLTQSSLAQQKAKLHKIQQTMDKVTNITLTDKRLTNDLM